MLSSVAGNDFTLTGDRQFVRASNNTVRFSDNTDGSIVGSFNKIFAAGENIQMNIIGDRTSTNTMTRGNVFTYTGEQNFGSLFAASVWMNANTSVELSGSENTLVANGINTVGKIVGNANNFVSLTEHSTIKMSGRELGIHGTGIDISLVPGSEATIFGRRNSYQNDYLSKVKFVDEPWRNETPTGWLNPTSTQPGKYTPPATLNNSGLFESLETKIGASEALSLNGGSGWYGSFY